VALEKKEQAKKLLADNILGTCTGSAFELGANYAVYAGDFLPT
jgi:hypothetical protein